MFSVAEEEVCRLLRSARELGRLTAVGCLKQRRSEIANRVAAEIHARSWLWLSGHWSYGALSHESGESSHRVSDPEPAYKSTHGSVEWSDKLYSPLTPIHRDNFDHCSAVTMLHELHRRSVSQLRFAAEIVVSVDPSIRMNSLTYVCVNSDGDAQWIEFLKPVAEPFHEFDRSFVSSMLEGLDLAPRESVDSEPHPDGSDSYATGSFPATVDLSKRQREVLELMLRGSSAKEIASELGISRHTVNDYSKALYRHFEVSGRAELTALFVHAIPRDTVSSIQNAKPNRLASSVG